MAMQLLLDGQIIRSESDFHDAVERASRIEFYGRNIDALWDLLTGLVKPPIEVRWTDATASREAIGPRFDTLIAIIREAAMERGTANFSLSIEP